MRSGFLIAIASVPLCVAFTACGDDFEACEATRTCTGEQIQGGGGQADDASGEGAGAGAPIDADGGRSDLGGATSAGGSGGAADIALGGASEGPSCVNIDTTSDVENCGSCGHGCLGGDCLLGVCQPIVLAKDQGSYIKITLASDYVYWTGDNATIGRVKSDGSTEAEELVPQSAGELGYDNVVVGQTLYWGNDFKDNGVRGCALPACTTPKTLLSGTLPVDAIHYSAAGKRLLWNQANVIWSRALPAGTSEVFFTTESRVDDLDSDEAFVYWNEYDPDKGVTKVRKRPLVGGGATLLAETAHASGTRVFGKQLYLTDGPEAGLHVIPLPNGVGNAATEAFAPSKDVTAIAVDADGVYWAEGGQVDEGTVRWCPHAGCTGAPVIKGSSGYPTSIVTDARAIYWGIYGGSVIKVAK